MPPTIAVAIATYNRATLLDECLEHLCRQPFMPGDEIIVVDNGSEDETPAVVARHASRCPVPLRQLQERRPGKSHALATGLAIASADVIAFTDDDVNVGAGWIAAIREAMADPEVAMMGGPVAPRWERKPPAWLRLDPVTYGRLASPLALLDYGPDAMELGTRILIGANMAVRRSVLERLGGFATHLGKRRGTLLSGEDHELCLRIHAAGLRARYCPDARVHHWVPADRMRVQYFLSWFFWSGITNSMLEESLTMPGLAVFGVPAWLMRRGATGFAGAVVATVGRRPWAAVERAIDTAYLAGYAARRWGFVSLISPAAERRQRST